MKKLLDEIRGQSETTREIMFGLCAFITIVFVGMAWYNSFENNIVALMNPEAVGSDNQYVETNSDQQASIFGGIGKSISSLGASILGFVGIDRDIEMSGSKSNSYQKSQGSRVYLLPLSGSK